MRERFRRFFAPSIYDDEEKTRTAQILNSLGWATFVVVLLLGISRQISGDMETGSTRIFFPAVLLIILASQVMIRLGYVKPAGIFMVSFIWLALTFQAWMSHGLRDAAILAFPLVILLCALLLGWREGLAVGILSGVVLWFFAYQEWQGLRPSLMDTPYNFARDLTTIFILSSVLIYILIHRLNRSLSDARLELRERLRAEEKLQSQARYLAALHDTALGLLNRLELNPLLESILDRVSELLETPHVGIDLLLPDGSALRQELGNGIFEDWNGYLTPKGIGLTGLVWERGETILAEDYESWDLRNPEAVGIGFCSVAGTPLKSGDAILGTLIVASTEKTHKFAPEQMILLERLAALASLAIDNARLYEESQSEIRERKTVEQDLRSSEERFRKVFNNSNIAISIVTLEDGIFIEANDAFWRLSGLTPERALGRPSIEFGLWEHPDERKQFVKDLLEQGSLENVEVAFNGGGETRSSLGYYELITIRNQLCILSMFYDISEQKQAQRSLKESETRMRAIIASIPDMIFEVSKDGVFLDFMASASLAPAMEPHEFIGRNIKELFPNTIADQTMFALERSLATGQVHSFEYGMPPGDEVQFFEARVAPVTSESAIIMVRDISQRKWVETEREKLIQELEDKNSELERFTYTVSHDLKSPIITIRGFLGFLEQDALSGNLARLKNDIKRISDATDKMQILLNELLDLSRIGRQVNPPVLVPFNDIVDDAVTLVQGRLQANNIQVQVQEDMDSVYVDRQRTVEAVQNLVDNAAKFANGGSKIEIGQEGREENMPVFYVRDHGIGIDPIHHERIFGLFNKLDADSEGTGVGLTLVKRIIEVHKGRIWVRSEPGKGSTFYFTLPPSGPES